MDYYSLTENMHNTLRFSMLSYLKTGNPIYDTILSTLIVTFISYVMKLVYDNTNRSFSFYDIQDAIKSAFFKRNSIIYEGTQSFVIARYETLPVVSSCFTDSFKALLQDVINNIKTNPSIYEIKEFISSFTANRNSSNTESDMYIISQKRSFLYNKDLQIYATAVIAEDGSSESKDGASIQCEKIIVTLFSYISTIDVIQQHVENIKNDYLESIEKSRNKKRYIYSLCKADYEDSKSECWREYEFESTRTFSNMFFEEKDSVLKKINFFINNKQWYYDNGIPYSIGFGLHGPPGTGKTSFFKCLSNLTCRHIVVISLKLIKTKRQLEDFFFENKYNEDNKKNNIGFDKKIIIFEDIDCIGDIVLKRYAKSNKKKKSKILNNASIENVLQKLVDNDDSSTEDNVINLPTKEPPLTLDDILNLWDGVKETPGRMLGISSNHYDKLDPALIRPGRIDVTIQLDNASHDIIEEMFTHYYKKPIDASKLKKIKKYFYSPAEIINCYVLYKDEPNKFMERLMQNKKL
jgi:hypothetical protein